MVFAAPTWVSYAAQAALIGRRVIRWVRAVWQTSGAS